MAPRPPNYSHERTQRERAQRLKNEEKAEKRAAKSEKRKARLAGQEAGPETIVPIGEDEA